MSAGSGQASRTVNIPDLQLAATSSPCLGCFEFQMRKFLFLLLNLLYCQCNPFNLPTLPSIHHLLEMHDNSLLRLNYFTTWIVCHINLDAMLDCELQVIAG